MLKIKVTAGLVYDDTSLLCLYLAAFSLCLYGLFLCTDDSGASSFSYKDTSSAE